MIEMFVAMTIVLVLVGVALLVLFASPWWATVLVVAGIVWLLDWMVNGQGPGTDSDEEAD